MQILRSLTTLTMAIALSAPAATADQLQPLLRTLQAVGPKGAGNREAARAWKELARADAGQLPAILAGLDDAGPLAANWIRTAVDAIAQRQLKRGGKLPAAELEEFTLDRRHAPKARRLAFEWLRRVDPSADPRLLPGMLDDPSLELRRDAVAQVIAEAIRVEELSEPAKAMPLYRKALSAARDVDQIRLLAARIRKAGRQVDLARHFGFILRWKLIGPFDNSGEKGYHVVYPPEREVNFDSTYTGKHGQLKWTDFASTDDYGTVDLNKGLGQQKEVVGYAATEFLSERQQEVEFRLSSFNAVKLWLGGKLIDEHNVYHGGSQMDQYVSRAVLQAGRNVILLKVCQNAQTQDWARYWYFQLRVCDAQGTAVLSEDRQ